MTAYYNEIDPYAAEWLRNLIAAGHIAPGVVDTRSIEDVHPADLQDFTQCHFFAGIGVWSLALRRAGWPDDRPVWTGSCPCQPFSAAGQGAGFADERHLWPAFGHLIAQCKPAVVIGEQVASKDVDVWIDLVHADLEALGYAFGSVPFPSAGIGAPHIRDRNYWVANAQLQQRPRRQRAVGAEHDALGRQQGAAAPARLRDALRLADAEVVRREGQCVRAGGRLPALGAADIGGAGRLANNDQHGRAALPEPELHDAPYHAEPRGDLHGLGNAERDGLRVGGRQAANLADQSGDGAIHPAATCGAGPTNGFWSDADWLGCRDGKWRPVEPGTFPLANGAAARVGRLRAYGNAINAEAARVFIEAVMEAA